MIPFPFRSIPDQDYFHLGDDHLTRCIRNATKEAGKQRWLDLTRNDGWTDFLIKSRDEGMVGVDTNHDSNEVEGLIDWVRNMTDQANPNLDPQTNDTEKCARLVQRFTSEQMLDEIIVTWAEQQGYIRDLPPTRPDELPDILKPILDNLLNRTAPHNIWDLLHNSTVFVNSTVSGNSTGPVHRRPLGNSSLFGNSTAPDNSTGVNDPLSLGGVGPVLWPLLKNETIPVDSTVAGNSTHQSKRKFSFRIDLPDLLDLPIPHLVVIQVDLP